MSRIFSWIKNNKLAFVLLLVVAYFLYKQYSLPLRYQISSPAIDYPAVGSGEMMMKSQDRAIGGIGMFPQPEAPPTQNIENRLVIQESYLSLQVTNVRESQDQIIGTAEDLGGYMVNRSLSNPQDAPTASVTVRVPSDKLKQALEAYRNLAVKVVSENLNGTDVTDQYVDNEARLATLEKTKTKFEEILASAIRVQDILEVQRELINLQSQIDAVIGQQKYYEQSAAMARLTVYLSTDEFALPYSPSESWRPEVIFKQAIRSLITHVRKLGTALIWLAVYSPVWLIGLLLIRFLRKKNIPT
ncbi:hypothetical protein A2774_04720 [Candidatus Roizmanbacteria bacterium RIFCSPHIGHO2_01_FULL_39_12c]|uniref:DUF4349 domain-containing protein n=1 Tax=Candidatus Roizmanbacteria bacterium RIFCSPHIGHO2_01_FULL_39_12c TaxID=1802031 RepID=A0A1F7GGE7_9BACT|nr:MAG: hypothetical protein A2774_04720 [Candidatus Roizmanbacteria bacterium RIFCSPHIGHO2_01_FULL_39_12c]OGK46232.1 MAG: hypothetical protein A2963_02075 [Candidatus Roizmanbacteria bacterium RIFCSPLOWO2_01_FULL_40_13]